MKQRVELYVPDQNHRVFIGTFHSFCAQILRQHGSHVGIKPDFEIYSLDNDLSALLDKAVEEAKKKSNLIGDTEKQALSVIKRLKAQLILPEKSKDVFRRTEDGEKYSILYQEYEKQLQKRNALDFNSLILKTYELFSKFPTFAHRYQTVYKYICVDEFQDTNLAQYKLLKSITGSKFRNLFTVADDDQIIYQWNGASHKRIKEFIQDYSAEVIQLPVNYRCPNRIVQIANNLIQHNFSRESYKKPIKSGRTESNQMVVRVLNGFPNELKEADEIVADIQKNHQNKLGTVAVLARTWRILESVRERMEQLHIPNVFLQRKDNFESAPFIFLHSMLMLANNRQDYESLDKVCGSFAQITGITVQPEDVKQQAIISNNDYLRNWLEHVRQSQESKTPHQILDHVDEFLIVSFQYQKFCQASMLWFENIVNDDIHGISNEFHGELFIGYSEEQEIWNALCQEIRSTLGREIPLEMFLQELKMRSKVPIPNDSTVQLITIHSSKGKEFKHVYLIGMVESVLPSYQSVKKGDTSLELEEERRNCFVAITRASETLTLTFADSYNKWKKQPSRFLYEMGLLKK